MKIVLKIYAFCQPVRSSQFSHKEFEQ